jgi:dipeptidyl aminopeptidase/acylaminoacyl peptidase
LTNHGRAFHGLARLDLATGALSWLAIPDGDVELLAISPDEKQLAYAVNVEGYGQLYVRDVASGEAVAQGSLPPGRPTSLVYGPDGVSLIVTHESFTAPPVIYRIDLVSRSAEPLVAGPIDLEIGDRVEPTIVNVPCFDGRLVPAFLFQPPGAAPPEGRPALVIVHGGPESQYAAHWRADVQYLVRHGWVVVAPNVRGSTGYGREWQSLDDRRLRMDSVKDLKAVRDWVAARPNVDAARLAVFGQS